VKRQNVPDPLCFGTLKKTMIRFFDRVALVGMVGLVGGTAFLATGASPEASKAATVVDTPPPLVEIAVAPRPALQKLPPIHTTDAMDQTFASLGYDLDAVRAGEAPVPRLFLAALPRDLHAIPEVERKKAVFFATVLPLVLQANEEILRDRQRLWRIVAETRLEREPSAADRLWLHGLAKRYKTSADKIDTLIARVDIIPPSLALAQAAKESGWGTSRFARQGNALFGVWTWSENGIAPKDREEGKTHKVKAYDALIDSVRDYMLNLNTHRAYRGIRNDRSAMRRQGEPIDGVVLSRNLLSYSAIGQRYVDALRSIIRANNLRRLDDARFAGSAT